MLNKRQAAVRPHDIGSDAKGTAIIALGNSLRRHVMEEGVETDVQQRLPAAV